MTRWHPRAGNRKRSATAGRVGRGRPPWQQEADLIGEHLAGFGGRLPGQLWEEHDALRERLKAAP